MVDAGLPFFEVERQRIRIFWRRVLHMAHHRTQLTVYLKMLDRTVPSTYGLCLAKMPSEGKRGLIRELGSRSESSF